MAIPHEEPPLFYKWVNQEKPQLTLIEGGMDGESNLIHLKDARSIDMEGEGRNAA